MLSPSELESMSRVIDDCYAEIESNLIYRVCRSLVYGKQESRVNQWRLKKLGQMGKLTKELVSYISSEAYKGNYKIEQAIDKAVNNSYAADLELFKDGHITVGTNQALPGIFEKEKKLILANSRKIMNFTNTTAIQISQQAYKDAINSAWVSARTGAVSIADAVSTACHQLGGAGLHVTYRSDKGNVTTYPLDASIRRDLITSLTQSTAAMMLAESAALDNDLVIISELADCRDTHLEFQNQVYSISGKSSKYPPLSSTGYGEPAGLFGCNCRHRMFPFFEDLDKEPQPMTESEKEEARENYEQSQKQRALEREIRAAKRQLIADEAAVPLFVEDSEKRLQRAQEAMTQFIADSGRTRRRERERA